MAGEPQYCIGAIYTQLLRDMAAVSAAISSAADSAFAVNRAIAEKEAEVTADAERGIAELEDYLRVIGERDD